MADQKTNVMRILEQKGISYVPHAYPASGGAVDGGTVARLIGADPRQVFKTLVTQGAGGGHFVFVIPVLHTLDLKAAARAAGEKSIALIPQAKLLPLTGYVHGGCSPVGMKKSFPTFLDSSAQELDAVIISAGKIGRQVELSPGRLLELLGGRLAPVSVPAGP